MLKTRLNFWQIWNMSFGFLGIQFGWGLQMANMSSIYGFLGADADLLPILWLAGPVTGIIIQPLIGQWSDRCWTRLGRRRPFILAGALLASFALVMMPHSSSVWMAAGLLWILDATINASMQPFRALVADQLPEEQNSQGFAIQSLFIGLGGTISSVLPWLMTHLFHVPAEAGGKGHIPQSVRLSFYLGAVALIVAVLWTVLRTSETPPSARELDNIRSRKFDWTLGLADVLALIFKLPRRMWELGLVQFFTWIGMFAMWVYFSPAIAKNIFHATEGSLAMAAAADWVGVCFGTYNAVCFIFSFVLLWAARRTGPRLMHVFCLAAGAAGLAFVPFAAGQYQLLFAMTGVGIAWASILSMPYAMLAPSLPPNQVGVMMGMFNLFVVLPQLLASNFLGRLLKHFMHNDPMNALFLGALSMGLASLLTLLVVGFRSQAPAPLAAAYSGGH